MRFALDVPPRPSRLAVLFLDDANTHTYTVYMGWTRNETQTTRSIWFRQSAR
jgi:hypothetical protein